MKTKYLLILPGCVVASALMAQAHRTAATVPQMRNAEKALYRPLSIPAEIAVPPAENTHIFYQPVAADRNTPEEEPVGSTFWDAQDYGCMSARTYAAANGDPVATWIYSNNDVHTVRGTGYNVRAGGGIGWGIVSENLESIRTGFPAVAVLGDGSEIAISHTTATTPWKLWVAKKAAGASTWTESSIPGPAGGIRMLWPKIAVGGPGNMTVHVIGITAQVGGTTGGVVYEGMNGHILYYRSTDGGATWDKQNVIIPGLDSSNYTGFSADTYTIDASGNTVAIGVFLPQSWNDVRLYKSSDNGENWSEIVVLDFPDTVEGYDPAPGNSYTVDDIPLDTLAPNELAVLTNDGFGSVLIDANGQAHVWFGRMYVMDDNYTDSTYWVYPGTNGILYWKESFGADNPRIITGALDYDGDEAIGISSLGEIAPYGAACISSFPVTGMDANGTIYLAYTALHELYKTNIGVDDEFYRHLYIMKSTDGGETWGDPHELTAPPYIEDFLVEFQECAYPSIPRHIGEKVWVLYQQDDLPGTFVWGGHHAAYENRIMWVEVDPANVPVGVLEAPRPDPSFALSLAPNPAASVVQLTVTLSGDGAALVEVFDMLGRRVLQNSIANNNAGSQTVSLPVQHLQTGTYQVRVRENGRFGIAKLLKT